MDAVRLHAKKTSRDNNASKYICGMPRSGCSVFVRAALPLELGALVCTNSSGNPPTLRRGP